MAYIQIIGAGSTELSEKRYASGLIVYAKGYYLGIDISPRNSFGITRKIHNKNFAFAVTHGHADHFDPEIPWREIFDPLFVSLNKPSTIRYAFLNRSTVEFLLKYNGLYKKNLFEKDCVEYNTQLIRVVKIKDILIISALDDPNRALKITLLRNNQVYKWGDIHFIPFEACHNWNMPPHPPFLVKDGRAIGFYFVKPFKGVYLPDFSLCTTTQRILRKLFKTYPPGYIIVGVTDPIKRKNASPHADINQIMNFFGEYATLYKSKLIFTHRNPLWERVNLSKFPPYIVLAQPFMKFLLK